MMVVKDLGSINGSKSYEASTTIKIIVDVDKKDTDLMAKSVRQHILDMIANWDPDAIVTADKVVFGDFMVQCTMIIGE